MYYHARVCPFKSARELHLIPTMKSSRTNSTVRSTFPFVWIVRAGDTARLVNQLLEHVERLTAEDFADSLRKVMGYTPLYGLMGALLALCYSGQSYQNGMPVHCVLAAITSIK